MNKILPLLVFSIISTQAQLIDAVAIDVEGQAITTLEIQAVQEKMNISKKAAVDALIRDRLELAAIKNAGINISDNEVEGKIRQIAASKGISLNKMQTLIAKKGLNWEQYKKELKLSMQKERFVQERIMGEITRPSDSELEAYYNTHREKFSASPTQMSLVVYRSDSAQMLKKAMANPIKPTAGVTRENVLVNANEMSPNILALINKTPNNSFTAPINTGKGFTAYFVKSKGGGQSGFTAVKNAVLAQWMQEKRLQASKDFLNKLKANAKIRVIRL